MLIKYRLELKHKILETYNYYTNLALYFCSSISVVVMGEFQVMKQRLLK